MNRRPIRRLLIANRGEIAVRIARTAHRLGMETVGVYSSADVAALHLDRVDRAVALVGTVEQYRNGEAIIEAARATGCDAIHPGYGFLAESAAFAAAVIAADLVWIGPRPEHIELLGNKLEAKRLAGRAGVATTPAYSVEDVPDDLAYPVLVKAASGGGGRGMRLVVSAQELPAEIEAAAREAAAVFGDGTVFIEPYIARGRHVEVQIAGDSRGNVIHLGERECSLQRRNQKIIEEAPSPGVSVATRQQLTTGAVELARLVGYESLGTVEFIVGEDGTVNFLEVNTRLQVEHPVTETVTGLDLVELQLRVASGEGLQLQQEDVVISGHAIEARLVAEDPARGWLPAIGRIGRFEVPSGVRLDSGVGPGSRITANYDSLLAKLVAFGDDRQTAAAVLRRSLQGAQITGVTTNRAAVTAVLGESDFLAGATFTSYFDDHPEVLNPPGPQGIDEIVLLAGAVLAVQRADQLANRATGFAPSGWRNLPIHGERTQWEYRSESLHTEVRFAAEDRATLLVGPWPQPADDGSLPPDDRDRHAIRLHGRSADEEVLEVEGVRHRVRVHIDGAESQATSAVGSLTLRRLPRFVVHEADEAGSGPIAPLPGTVIAVNVSPGDHVEEGAVMMIVEAMKMEHRIVAPAAGTVGATRFAVGDRVEAGDLLVELHVGN